MLQDVLQKALKASQLKLPAEELIDNYRVSQRRACSEVMLHRSSLHYKHSKREDSPVRYRIREIAETRVR